MFIPSAFEQHDLDQLRNMISEYPLATLITMSDDGLEANHIPLYLNTVNGADVLQGHLSKVNPLWNSLIDQSEVLVIFHGPNSYISPSYYPTKKETGMAVPTWNYVAVHVKGSIKCIHDRDWNRDMINRLTNQHEKDRKEPWAVSDAPAEFTEKMLNAIVGIEVNILSIAGKWKLSQNQPEKNKLGVVVGLSEENKTDSHELVEFIKQASLNSVNK